MRHCSFFPMSRKGRSTQLIPLLLTRGVACLPQSFQLKISGFSSKRLNKTFDRWMIRKAVKGSGRSCLSVAIYRTTVCGNESKTSSRQRRADRRFEWVTRYYVKSGFGEPHEYWGSAFSIHLHGRACLRVFTYKLQSYLEQHIVMYA